MKRKYVMPTGDIVERELVDFKTPYNHDTNFESDRTALYCADQSLTKQEFKEETDINNIIGRFLKTGEPPPMPLPEHFMDLTGRKTYFEMQQQIATANASFYELPAALRAEFQNTPATWADAVCQAVADKDGNRLNELGINIEIRAPAEPSKTGTPTAETPAAVPQKEALSASQKAPSGAKSDT